MGHNVTIGGERLGSGKKMKAYLHNYERSTHDLSYVWRSTMASGTLVPFMSQVALPGDTFDIDLNCEILTKPTVGPLFGSYKVQLDVFEVPIRLYQAKLHMNMLGIGMDMSKVALPQVVMNAPGINIVEQLDNQQINPSSIWSYLGIRGLGISASGDVRAAVQRNFNAIPYLGYWDIYKNYYANKQEEIGAVIHKDVTPYDPELTTMEWTNVYAGGVDSWTMPVTEPSPWFWMRIIANVASVLTIEGANIANNFDPGAVQIFISSNNTDNEEALPIPQLLTDIFQTFQIDTVTGRVFCSDPIQSWWESHSRYFLYGNYNQALEDELDTEPTIVTFPLENIDNMRKAILAHLTDDAFEVTAASAEPYGLPLQKVEQVDLSFRYPQLFSQEGLALKTYQSDLFNNWISTEWIDGPDGISAITAVDTSAGSFTIDELNMSKKIYDMLNRIAISGGSYDDWLDAVYTHERQRSAENPMYAGGLIRNLIFQEVVSNAASESQPLGTLAGRGKMGNKDKGGHIVIKTNEPSYIMGIVSITPHIDYSQGNMWDTNLLTLNDLHKPALDEIGFQDLITDQMAWFDTTVDAGIGPNSFKSAGKQPAWVNYMTNVNVVKGNFADESEMFMVLNRRYEPEIEGTASVTIKDLTTYIDPTKFNHIFADTRRDAQNFWAQIGVNIEARRKMSAKIMPNL